MIRWDARVLLRIRRLAAAGRVTMTHKARTELALLGMDETDAQDVIAALSRRQSRGRTRSRATNEWMYVFRATAWDVPVYIKLLLRTT